ncbi:MAG: LysM peptidoglycan-binding domain-containing protein [Planctomycetaceae bacterium]|jgi:nucleoid-associated protein YgaU|nr:LysM peptidoglycan-binding domain-containing protein [Planctomycetaceae bacterium]MBT6919701.1 LysM peptidoglycan-binding domain-containing protein [Planctomycetaceae bacterium]MBT7728354.1 LysM peptidoglycan-binding domain-containing protein [Planctomycetaceae bacterium]
MTSLVQVFRFLVGLGLVIAGSFVAAPLISSILSAATSGPVPSGQVQRASQGRTSQSAIHAFTVPGSVSVVTDPVQYTYDSLDSSLTPPNETSSSQGPMELPERMPKHSLGATPPDLYGAYRTTVEMPPPPLLDGSQDVAKYRTDRTTNKSKGPRRQMPDSIPETYRVQDGDDLTGIATRLYGHPRAATALWQMNANRLSSPEVLPIGFEMVVPPAWRVFGKSDSHGDAYRIEPVESPGVEVPRRASVHATSMQSESFVKQHEPALNQGTGNPWLGRAQERHSVYPEKTITTQSRGTIRVAPGETLVSLAQRVYGNANMADSIFNANRDRLRNPALLVPGTELRLP